MLAAGVSGGRNCRCSHGRGSRSSRRWGAVTTEHGSLGNYYYQETDGREGEQR